LFIILFSFNDPSSSAIYTLSLHDALPILVVGFSIITNVTSNSEKKQTELMAEQEKLAAEKKRLEDEKNRLQSAPKTFKLVQALRSEEHTSELQSRGHLVCRLLLEKKKKK